MRLKAKWKKAYNTTAVIRKMRLLSLESHCQEQSQDCSNGQELHQIEEETHYNDKSNENAKNN